MIFFSSQTCIGRPHPTLGQVLEDKMEFRKQLTSDVNFVPKMKTNNAKKIQAKK